MIRFAPAVAGRMLALSSPDPAWIGGTGGSTAAESSARGAALGSAEAALVGKSRSGAPRGGALAQGAFGIDAAPLSVSVISCRTAAEQSVAFAPLTADSGAVPWTNREGREYVLFASIGVPFARTNAVTVAID